MAKYTSSPGHLSAVESDLTQRSDAPGLDGLDGGTSADRYRQSVSPRWIMAGKKIHVAQTNNSYIFPGLALGIIASKARFVTDTMVKAAATELIRHLPTQKDKQATLLPPISQARELGRSDRGGCGKTGDQGWPGAGRRRGCAAVVNLTPIFGNRNTYPTSAKNK